MTVVCLVVGPQDDFLKRTRCLDQKIEFDCTGTRDRYLTASNMEVGWWSNLCRGQLGLEDGWLEGGLNRVGDGGKARDEDWFRMAGKS
jgi:hypothetical protein